MGPLWCKNVVSLYGPLEHIAELVEQVQGEMDFEFGHYLNGEPVTGQRLSFASIIPFDGYWDSSVSLKKWGVKCDAVSVNLNYCHADFAIYEFLTPFGPPFPVCDALKDRFPDIFVSWHFNEPKNELTGYIKSKTKIKIGS
jgi:hypothetical protein